MLRSREVWRLVVEKAPRGEWLRVRDLYAFVEAHSELDATDRQAINNGASARWHRTVRNAMQGAKKRGDVRFERGKGFLLEPASPEPRPIRSEPPAS